MVAPIRLRVDLLEELVTKRPEWRPFVDQVIKLNAYYVWPRKYVTVDYGNDEDLVLFDGTSTPLVFSLDEGGTTVSCVNDTTRYQSLEVEVFWQLVARVSNWMSQYAHSIILDKTTT